MLHEIEPAQGVPVQEELGPGCVTEADTFLGLSSSAVADVLAHGRPEAVTEGSYVYEMGQTQDGVYFLKAGIVEEFRVTPEGQKLLIRRVGPGQFFGVASSGLGNYCCFAQAKTECEAVFMSFRQLESICKSHPQVVINLLRWFAGRLGEVEERFEAISFERLRARVARSLLNLVQSQGSKTINVTQETLSTWLPASRPKVSQALQHLQQLGAIRLYRGRIEVIDENLLQRESVEAAEL